MLNIHLKIQAKTLLQLNNSKKSIIILTGFKASKLLKTVYKVFEQDSFMLPYRVQKLSKRARRNTTIKTQF